MDSKILEIKKKFLAGHSEGWAYVQLRDLGRTRKACDNIMRQWRGQKTSKK